MNPNQLSHIKLRGFKSIRECDLILKDMNVLIGLNGAGKSNFIGFFKLIQKMLEGKLQLYVSRNGGPDALLHFGRKNTEKIRAEFFFGNNGYKFILEPTQDNRMMIASEAFWWNVNGDTLINVGHFETAVETQKDTNYYKYIVPAMKSWRVYTHYTSRCES